MRRLQTVGENRITPALSLCQLDSEQDMDAAVVWEGWSEGVHEKLIDCSTVSAS